MRSINPFNNNKLQSYYEAKPAEVTTKLNKIHANVQNWQLSGFSKRREKLLNLANLLEKQGPELSIVITSEMGKPIAQSRKEIEKCVALCRHYAEHGESYLQDRQLSTSYARSLVTYEPLGIILTVMPWNYPFWQVFRQAIPCIMAGNVIVLKHASNVPQCAMEIEKLFATAGFPEYCFTTFIMKNEHTHFILEHEGVQGVALTGSEAAGSSVASIAGKNLKKSVLELGGSDPFIVLPDADLPKTIRGAIQGRFQNSGQTCIAAKRFLIHEDIYDDFLNGFLDATSQLKLGDPMNENTYIGPLAKREFVEQLHEQVKASVFEGATIQIGGEFSGDFNQFYQPTILTEVHPGIPAFDQELFGPVAACMKVSSSEEAIQLANQSRFGLGATIWTENTSNAIDMARSIVTGTVTINDIVKSDPLIPFGGVKASGFGRELARLGMLEFTNVKAINVYK